MKKGLLVLSTLLTCTFAHAGQVDWQSVVEQHKQKMTTVSTAGLWGREVYYTAASAAVCSVDVVATAGAFAVDTTPLLNGASQIVGTYPNLDEILANLFTWNAITNATRGTVGGAVVGVSDTLQFIYLWLGGDTAGSIEELAKTYVSTITVANKLFAEQGQCMMNLAKLIVVNTELINRGAINPADVGIIYIQP